MARNLALETPKIEIGVLFIMRLSIRDLCLVLILASPGVHASTLYYFSSSGGGKTDAVYSEILERDQKTIVKRTEVKMCDGENTIEEFLRSQAEGDAFKYEPMSFHFLRKFKGKSVLEISAQRELPSKPELTLEIFKDNLKQASKKRTLSEGEILDSHFYNLVYEKLLKQDTKARDMKATVLFEDRAEDGLAPISVQVTRLPKKKADFTLSSLLGEFLLKLDPKSGEMLSLEAKNKSFKSERISKTMFEKKLASLECFHKSK